jgi:cell division ATPase FtsA
MPKRKEKETKVSDIAGSWDITAEEAEEIKTSISQMLETWKPQKQSFKIAN